MASTGGSFLIIGAGLFGVSTALSLIQEKPRANITLVDRTPFPNPSSASYDRGKIIRTDYADLFYMKLALEAQKEWMENPTFKDYFHQVGIAFAEKTGTGTASIENFKTLGLNPAEMLSPKDARSRWGSAFNNAKWDDVKEIYWNPNSGYADAEEAMRGITQLAITKGVKYRETTVSTLILDDNGSCTGVCTDSGNLHAEHTILCTGAFTARLLANTAPANNELQVEERLVAAGAISCTATIAPELIGQFKDAPVFFHGLSRTPGEGLPVNNKGQLKFNCENTFTRMMHRPYSNEKISVPPSMGKFSTWGSRENVPKVLRDEVDAVVRNVYGNSIGIQIDSYRICWDSITPTQDFLITPHPHCMNLYLATGGSFHAWKFLPIIGKYVVKMLDGKLEEDYENRWAWDKTHEGAACKMYVPERDFNSIVGSDLDRF